ncbi:hypothetical protein BC827DRAFT_751371 [Russula dissimulans]|nr:hypothetical protein BC827DRAFT_751371 [Russula dissimulans]
MLTSPYTTLTNLPWQKAPDRPPPLSSAWWCAHERLSSTGVVPLQGPPHYSRIPVNQVSLIRTASLCPCVCRRTRLPHAPQCGGSDPMTSIDLTNSPVDAVAVSFYKVFGSPTGIGSWPREKRPWFSGGTIGVVQAPGTTRIIPGWHAQLCPFCSDDGPSSSRCITHHCALGLLCTPSPTLSALEEAAGRKVSLVRISFGLASCCQWTDIWRVRCCAIQALNEGWATDSGSPLVALPSGEF